jgi:hypothetical protein
VRYEQAETPPGAPPMLTTEQQFGLPFTLNFGALWQF